MQRHRTNHPAFAGRPAGPDYVSHRLNLAWFTFALGVKDPYTEAHARRVAAYAGRLAISMNLAAEKVDNIWLAGLLHDIGKIALNEGIFRSTQAQLTKDMQAEVQRHPFVGISILKQFQFPAAVQKYVYCHHEKVDGSGYPCGLTANEIPLGAKIISAVDCFDAMTTDRPYQKGKTVTRALAILRQISGTCLCPDVVRLLSKDILDHGPIVMAPRSSHEFRFTSLLHA
jgi:putative nucleotidyltransferase with HDIG domain